MNGRVNVLRRTRKAVRALLFPNGRVLPALCVLSAGMLAAVFLQNWRYSAIAYAAYVGSAYTLLVPCLAVHQRVKHGLAWVKGHNEWVGRYLNDLSFRAHVSLYISLTINVVYAVAKFFSGIYYHSFWFGSIAVYYFCLAVMRFMLLRHANRNRFGENQSSEFKRYRICGGILTVLNLALTGMVILMVTHNYAYNYPGTLIYAMGAYTFYNIITASMNVVKYRKQNSPVLSASKMIQLASALVSMLALETAMLAKFGDNEMPLFRLAMTAATGAGVCLIVLGMALYMILHSTRQLRKLKGAAHK